jgi:hypothetical protein
MEFMNTWFNEDEYKEKTLPEVLRETFVRDAFLDCEHLEELIEYGKVLIEKKFDEDLIDIGEFYENEYGIAICIEKGPDDNHCFITFDTPPEKKEIDRLKKLAAGWRKKALESTKEIREDIDLNKKKRSEGTILVPYCPNFEEHYPEAYNFLVNVMPFKIDTFDQARSIEAIETGSFDNIQKCWEVYMKNYAEQMEPQVKKLKRIY